MKSRFASTLLLLLLPQAPALAAGIADLPLEIKVEPIIGFESSKKLVPEPHTTTRLVYGARAIGGLRVLSGEAEYTRSSDTETFPLQALSVTDSAERLKIGLRTSYALLPPVLEVLARGGGQATQNRHDETRGTVLTSTIEKVVIKPYVGAGFALAMGPHLKASFEAVAVINDVHDLGQTEFQTTGGIAFGL